MIRLSLRLRGPGHASCKEMSVVTHDGPSRHMRFRLKRINQDFGKVLCMADARTLRNTAVEILEIVKQSGRCNLLTDDLSTSSDASSPVVDKTAGFWTVFSKRFKASLPILSARDTVKIIRAFDAAKQDTGVYVAAVLPLKQKIHELDKSSLIHGLHVLSKRLKKNTQKEFFSSIANHVPNVFWQMKALDMVATLWHLSQACHTDSSLAKYMQPKFCKLAEGLNDIELGTAALAFARHGHSDVRLFERIREIFPLDCSGEALFRLSWGFTMAGVEVADLLHNHAATVKDHVRVSDSRISDIWRDILRNTHLYSEVFTAS